MRKFLIDFLKIEGDGLKIDVRKGTIGNLIMSSSWQSKIRRRRFIKLKKYMDG